MPPQESLFNTQYLHAAHFTRLLEKGRESCRNTITALASNEESGFVQFLEEGWYILSDEDIELRNWLVEMIRIEHIDVHPEHHEKIARSIRYGAACIYYPLYIQSTYDGTDIPQMSTSQKGSLSVDLLRQDSQPLLTFMSEYDNLLCQFIHVIRDNTALTCLMDIDPEYLYQGAYFTYFALAHAAEQQGFSNSFTVSPGPVSSEQ